MDPDLFHPLIRDWFIQRFGEPTEPQRQGWPAIASGTPTLIAAPTGSGKTLAAFLVCLDRLFRQWLDGKLADGTQVVYVSPLKALSNDIRKNLEGPLAEICERAFAAGYGLPRIRTAVRTGDTPASERQQMLRRPPHVLVTTPESLFLMVTSEKSRQLLRGTRTVIVDEIHALARDKRGSHLAITLERLDHLCDERPVRIGLSATQRPIEEIARFLCGAAESVLDERERSEPTSDASLADEVNQTQPADQFNSAERADPANEAIVPAARPCRIIDVGHIRELDLALELPPSELAAVCSNEQWDEVYAQLTQLIQRHRSTLVFVNTRRLAERIAHRLTELLGEDAVASHHGSLSRELRFDAEQRLKSGQLKALVATASLEMGIDIGYIDLVCQVGSPRSIANFLQRVGRSGHSLRAIPKGRLFPLTRDELLECLALVRGVRRGVLDAVEMPVAPLDILAQQIVAAVSCEEWSEESLYRLICRAWPYRGLSREQFDAIVRMVSEGLTPQVRRGAFIHRDQIQGILRARRGARLAALTSGGAIPEAPLYRVVTEPEGTYVGEVDEHFAVDSSAGDVFLLGTTSWRITAVRGQEVKVRDAEGAPPTVPFWFGESPGRSHELSTQLSSVRAELAGILQRPPPPTETRSAEALAAQWLKDECGASDEAAGQAVRYIAAQLAALGIVPTTRDVVFERFFDESGGMQLVIHAPFGHRVNRAWGLALRKRFCRSFDFELQAAATDNGILLSIGPQHSFPIEQLFKMLGPHNGQELLQQALFATPVFPVRWRWNVSRALAVLRFQSGKKVPFFLQRFRADDLLAATFPATVGCLENHHGDIEIPDHPLVKQTLDDCLHEALDVRRWLQVLGDYQRGSVQFLPRDTREPSPFSHELLNANPYAFLDPAGLEERRTRAVSTRRSLSPDDFRNLSQLDPDAVSQVVADATPLVRDLDELHDMLLQTVVASESPDPRQVEWFHKLVEQGRAARVLVEADGAKTAFWIASERWPVVRAAYGDPTVEPPVRLPNDLDREWQRSDAWVELTRGQMATRGPITARQLATHLRLDEAFVHSSLEALEGQGIVLRGNFLPAERGNESAATASSNASSDRAVGMETQWCDRRLLARIHRLTLEGLRRRIQPVSPSEFVRFLIRHQRWGGGYGSGPAGVREALAQLEGFELPAAAWERLVLAPRVAHYDGNWLDQLFLAGDATWGRLRPPRKEPSEEATRSAMTRAMPLALVLREDLPWLLPPDRVVAANVAREETGLVLSTLRQRGALFLPELRILTRLTREQVQESLRELASLGLVTSDAFAAVRAIVSRKQSERESTFLSPVGRWSLFPGLLLELSLATSDAAGETRRGTQLTRVERWCWLLLKRYGVVFRDLLARESAAPPWSEIAPVLRRMELRGEVRGGRFVAGVAGEQFATEASVTQLRAIREEPLEPWIVISAADPLNLSGIIGEGPRVPATHRNSLVLRGGVCVAARRGGEVEFFAELDQSLRSEIREALEHVRRKPSGTASGSAVPPQDSPTMPLRSAALNASSNTPQDGAPPALSPREKSREIRRRWTDF